MSHDLRPDSSVRTHKYFMHQVLEETLVLSFIRPVQVISWAILNGGFRSETAHIINHHVEDCSSNRSPGETPRKVAGRLGLKGTVVGK
jgi:adenosylcobinamide amidohydrolase